MTKRLSGTLKLLTKVNHRLLTRAARKQVVTAVLLAVTASASEQNELDVSPSLFSVLAAINAAGYDAEIDSPSNHPLRAQVRQYVAARKPESLDELKRFFNRHRRPNGAIELSQYISFALTVDGPPKFRSRFHQNETPPDVEALEDFGKLMERFHREAGIDELWKQTQPAHEAAIARYHEPTLKAVLEVKAYLRMAGAGYLGHRFQVYLDLLGAPNQIQVRRYKDEYFVVITPSPQPQIGDIRQAYLHFLIEPLAAKYADDLKTKSALADYAGAAPLDPHYKDDFLLLATKSLVKAAESRIAGPRGAAMVEAALREGYILAPHFAEQLVLYEAQEQAMKLYFPELIKSIDLKKEERRLEKVEFASALAVRKAKTTPRPAEPEPQLTGAAKTADDAERLYRERNLDAARKHFTRLLSETDERPMQARAYYGLARIATLEKNPELAEKLFQKTLELEPEGQVKSWAYVYLGRLSDLAGEREQATRNYQAALAVEGASPGAREAAEKGIKESFPRK